MAKNTFKKVTGQVHLWLGLITGALVLFLGITGCILAFEREIEDATQPYRFSPVENRALLPPSKVKAIAIAQLPAKHLHSVTYQPGHSTTAVFYNYNPEYFYQVYLNPYTGKVLKVKDMSQDFFRIVINGHYYLWLPPQIGQPIVATGTLLFVILLISGIILWWPKNKAARKQRFSIKWTARWRRVNYDLHNVLGFYMTWVIIFIAITGLVMGFQWFASSVYWVTSGGNKMVAFYEAQSDSTKAMVHAQPADAIWQQTTQSLPQFNGSIDVHIPENNKAAIEIAVNPDTKTYWKMDYRYYDQRTLKEIPVKHANGRLSNAGVGDKIARMNYDIHVGAIAGIPGKVMAFFASLIAASMPVTGFIIWRGRNKKNKAGKRTKALKKEAPATAVM
jgi:uncharacterized iron-regulated membrane protein